MSGPQDPRFLLVGANHRSASVDLRDRLFVDESDFGEILSRLRGAGLDQALLLSTCDRVEVHALHADPAVAERAIIETLAAHAGLAPDDIASDLYVLRDEAAARHLFAIAASLESLVIGEPFVLGQVKESHRAARAADMVGADLERLLQAAYAAAKRVRSETAIGERPVSIAAAALAVARDVHGDLAGATGLVIGVGEMAELVARQMREAGLGRLVVSHRSAARAAVAGAPARRQCSADRGTRRRARRRRHRDLRRRARRLCAEPRSDGRGARAPAPAAGLRR